MIHSGIEVGLFFETSLDTSIKACQNLIASSQPFLQIIFVFVQMYFIFLNQKVIVFSWFLPAFVRTYNAGLSFALLSSCSCGHINQNAALFSNFTMLSAYCIAALPGSLAPGSLARQPCPAALPGSLARQLCPAALPDSLARQPCPAALPGSLTRQPCPATLPGSFAEILLA
jgi:hypothetical protein